MTRDATAEIGIFGGTGLYDLDALQDVEDIQVETPYGATSAHLRTGTLGGRRVVFLARHGDHHRLMPGEIPYRANVWAMKSLGVSKVLSPSAVGSLREKLPPRMLVVPDQYVDRTRHRGDTFFGDGIVVHVSLSDPFSDALRTALVEAATEADRPVHDGGTYLCMEGPQFSTRAESRWYRQMGCDIIGMTSLTEARLCREAEIAYASLAMVTDYDAWREAEEAVVASEILAVLADNVDAAREVVCAAIPKIPEGPLPENDSLAHALVTPLDKVPEATKERLAPILGRYL
jgi:5'-methylthioadenosine phosphorylase